MSRPYAVKEIFYSVQGEGAHSGRPAVFCRFSGCNLWSGREVDRLSAICRMCDTDFVGIDGTEGGRYSATELVRAISACGPFERHGSRRGFVVLTGGEPSLQVREELVGLLKTYNFEIAIETNGTNTLPLGIDWVTVSPKAGADLKVVSGHELKLAYPQVGGEPPLYESLDFRNFYLQPIDGPLVEEHTRSALSYCLKNPRWKVSLQIHKFLGIR